MLIILLIIVVLSAFCAVSCKKDDKVTVGILVTATHSALDNAKEGDEVGEIKVFFKKDLLKTIKLVTMNKIDKLIDSGTLEICEILWSEDLK